VNGGEFAVLPIPQALSSCRGSRRLRDCRPQVRPQQNWFTQRTDNGIQSVLETTYSTQRDCASTRDMFRTSGTQIFHCIWRFWMYVNLCRGFFFCTNETKWTHQGFTTVSQSVLYFSFRQ